jgi:Mg-chelatase subunit ChlD
LVLAPGRASAVTPGTYGAPSWFPLRGGHLIGCAYKSTGPVCGGTYHDYPAIDIKGAKGEAVYAAGAGKVVEAVNNQGGNCNPKIVNKAEKCPNGSRGNHVLIDHGNGVFSYYQHLLSVSVPIPVSAEKPTWVDENTPIGTVGDSGWSTPGFYHLHFERRPVQTPSPGVERIDPGPLKACVGTELKTYPQAFGYNTWQGLPGHKFTAHSDGTSCARSSGGGTGGVGGGGKPKVDLVFAIDTTGSMGPYINGVKLAARSITSQLFRLADARVALVDYKDLYASCPSDGYAARIDLPFSTDSIAFDTAVGTLSAAGGCDWPESVYSGLMKAIGLPWRDGVIKAVIVMGDAPPHDPEPTTNFTRSSVSAAAIAVDPAAIYSINIEGGGSPYFEDLASDTGGKTYPASDPSTAVEQITTAITAITESALIADAGGPYAGTVGEPVTFDASLSSGPADADIVSYEWDFDGNGSYDQSTALPTVSHVYSAPFSGTIGLRVTTNATPGETATATAPVQILTPTTLKYTGERGGAVGHEVHMQAFLSDNTGASVPDTTVEFSLGAQSCKATTDQIGKANCEIIPQQSPGSYTLYAEATPKAPYFASAVTSTFTLGGQESPPGG